MAVSRNRKQWNHTGRMLTIMGVNFINNVDDVIQENANIYRDSILDMIDTGNPSWVPKSEKYAKETTPKLYIGRTGSYYDTLQNRSFRRIKGNSEVRKIFIGARYDVIHPASKMTMETISNILQNLPSEGDRPLFGPAWERVRGIIMRNLLDAGLYFE